MAFWRSEILVGRRSCNILSVSAKDRRTFVKTAYLVNQGEAQAQAIGNGSRALCASSIWTDDDCVSVPGNVPFNIPLQQRLTVEVIHGNVKESLVP